MAYFKIAALHSRTWETLPGEDSTTSVKMVCMESMIIESGWILAACVKICSRCVSHRMKQFGLSCDNRSARSFNWRLLSSPETYRVFKPVKPNTVCKTKVDFPIPGSPPIKTKEPFTKPPPRTLFNSSSFKSIRASSSVVISRNNTGRILLPSIIPGTGRFTAGSFVTISST